MSSRAGGDWQEGSSGCLPRCACWVLISGSAMLLCPHLPSSTRGPLPAGAALPIPEPWCPTKTWNPIPVWWPSTKLPLPMLCALDVLITFGGGLVYLFERSEFQESRAFCGVVFRGHMERIQSLPQLFPLTPRRDTGRVEGMREYI